MSVENPVHILTHEHKYILKVVHALGVLDHDLQEGKAIDPDLIQGVVDFMRNFADKCHHAKEEAVLFPAMEDKGVPKTGCPLSALRSEHVKGRELVGALEKAGSDYAKGDRDAIASMHEAIGGIRKLYPNHIWKEDEMVFPMTERLFSEDDLERLSRDFEEAEREVGTDHEKYVAFAEEMERLMSREHTA